MEPRENLVFSSTDWCHCKVPQYRILVTHVKNSPLSLFWRRWKGQGRSFVHLQLRCHLQRTTIFWIGANTKPIMSSHHHFLFHGGGFIYWTSFQDLKEFEDDAAIEQRGMGWMKECSSSCTLNDTKNWLYTFPDALTLSSTSVDALLQFQTDTRHFPTSFKTKEQNHEMHWKESRGKENDAISF